MSPNAQKDRRDPDGQSQGSKDVSSSEWSGHMLNWRATALIGREKETQLILETVARVSNDGAAAEAILIYGPSGIGKSSVLEDALIKTESSKVIWASGKYDQQGSRTPFAAVAEATAELYNKIHTQTPLVHKIQKKFSVEELGLLSAIVPQLGDLLPSGASGEHVVNQHTFHGFVRLYRRLLKVICQTHTVVLNLDDLQWADEVSRELLESLATDDQIKNLLFLGAIRIGEEQSFALPVNCTMRSTTIDFHPLVQEDSNQMVAVALELPKEETKELGDIVHRRSGGNPFFIVQFLEALCQDGHIKFNETSNRFEWDVDTILRETKATVNVVDLLVSRIGSMGRDIQVVLVLAAHLGFSFQAELLENVLESVELVSLFPRSLGGSGSIILLPTLKRAVRFGLIEQCSSTSNRYKFTHDRVQQSAASLLPSGKAGEKILATFGRVVLQLSKSNTSEDWMVFAAVKLLTASNSKLATREMAELCLRATLAAKKKSAFRQAAKYADLGMKTLGSGGWKVHYRLHLELCTLSAELHYAYGNMDTSKKRVKLIEQNSRSVEDRFRAYNVLLDTLLAEANFAAGIEESRRGLGDLGIKVPTKPGRTAVRSHCMKTKKLLRGRKAADLEKLPKMTDLAMKEALYLLANAAVASWHNGDVDLTTILCCIQMQVILEHGICDEGLYVFANYMICLLHLGDVATAKEYFELAERLSSVEGADRAKAMVFPRTHFFGNFLYSEIAATPTGATKAYEAGMRVGDVLHATLSVRCIAVFQIFVGCPKLSDIEQTHRSAAEFFRDYKQPWSHALTQPWMQVIECLSGKVEKTSKLRGSFFEEDTVLVPYLDGSRRDTMHCMLVATTYYARVFVQLVLGNYRLVFDDLATYESVPEEMSSYVQKIQNYFHVALACLALAKQEGKQVGKLKSKAQKYTKFLKTHNEMGSPFITAALDLLEAEQLALRKEVKKAACLYEQAIAKFDRQECYLYKAIALERAGSFRETVGDSVGSQRLLKQAYQEFGAFGALAKLPMMETRYKSMEFATVPVTVDTFP